MKKRMQYEIECPHCKSKDFDFEPRPEQMSYLFKCKKCGCTFRLVLVYWNPKCYMDYYKKVESKKPKPEPMKVDLPKEKGRKRKRKSNLPKKRSGEEW